MKKINKNYILSFLVFIFSVGIVSSWTNLGTVTSGTNLTDTIWNNLITQVNETGNRVSGIFTDGSGNVGIGTETPNSKLDVNGSITVGGSHIITKGSNGGLVLNAGPADGSNVAGIWFRKNNTLGINTSYVDLMRITETGNVGIGTTTPTAKLQVTGGQTVLEQQSWQNVTFQNGWVDYGVDYSPTSYFKDSNGVVHLRGLVKNGTIGVCAFTLPTGYRPPYRVLFTVQTNPNVASRFDIQASGCAVINGSNARTSLDGISFGTH
ncbi:MAG: hypothetical protein PHS49_05645 [Candidatus Gracilibacteria bacterium]|nr:hypothetical protein [Candidatus Gracilibacteria bacterium]